MFKTFQGVTEDAKNTVYLRPETAQGIFVNFQNVQRTTRKKLPFGVCQVGKSFRNEITPGNFTFRTREFEQMELEFFCKPGTELEWFKYWKDFCHKWLLNLGMKDENLRLRDHDPEELSHYSNATTDFEFAFPFGWGELWGVASRTNYDLNAHQTTSGKDQTYFDQESGEHYIPYRHRAFPGCRPRDPGLPGGRLRRGGRGPGQERQGRRPRGPAPAPRSGTLQVRRAAPVQEAGRPGPGAAGRPVQGLHGATMTTPAPSASAIAARTRSAPPTASPWTSTPWATPTRTGDNCVTVRDRDTMEQVRLPISELKAYLREKMAF